MTDHEKPHPPPKSSWHKGPAGLLARLFVALPLLLPIGGPAASNPTPPTEFGYPQVLAIAADHNPSVVEARAALAAAEGRLAEARLYPNPFLEAGSDGFDDHDEARSSVMIGQPVIVGKRRTADTRMREADVEAREQEYEQALRTALRQAGELYVELLYHRDNLALAWNIYDDAERVRGAAKDLAARDAVPVSDLERAAAAAEEAYLDVTRHVAELTFAAQRLEVALGTRKMDVDRLSGRLLEGQINEELRDARDQDVADHPELRAADERLEVERRAERLARAEIVPDVTLRVGGGYDSMRNESFAAAGFMVPIPLWDRNQGRVREARGLAARASEERDDTGRRLEVDVLELSQRINELDTFVQGYAVEIVPARQRAYAEVSRAYADGKTTVHDILSVQAEYFASRRQLLTNRWLLSQAHVRLRYWLDAQEGPDLFAVPE